MGGEGDPFSFLSVESDDEDKDSDHGNRDKDSTHGDGNQNSTHGGGDQDSLNGGGDQDSPNGGGDQDLPPDSFSIDDDIPLPFQCTTSNERTSCLQKLVPDRNEITKTFHGLVERVDALKVSYVLSMSSPLYLIQF